MCVCVRGDVDWREDLRGGQLPLLRSDRRGTSRAEPPAEVGGSGGRRAANDRGDGNDDEYGEAKETTTTAAVDGKKQEVRKYNIHNIVVWVSTPSSG